MRRECRGGPGVVLLAMLLAACGAATSSTHDDGSISTRVKIALLQDPQLGALRIDARTFQGVVTLSGTVPSQAVADQAIAVARKVRGVRDVTSELKVEGTQASCPSIAELVTSLPS